MACQGADEVVGHASSDGFQAGHTQRLAAHWAQALRGPAGQARFRGEAIDWTLREVTDDQAAGRQVVR